MTLNFSDSALLAFRVTWPEERQAVGQSLSRAGMELGTGQLQAGQLFQKSLSVCCWWQKEPDPGDLLLLGVSAFLTAPSKLTSGLMDEVPAHGQWVRTEVPSCMAGLHLLL